MSKIRTYSRSLFSNWVGFGANVVISFVLTPFIVHSLGNATYGLWTLLVSLTGYLGLADVGVRSGTGRFINYYLGRGEPHKVSNVINTSLVFFAGIGVLVFVVAGILGAYFGDIFRKFPEEFVAVARPVLLLLGVNVWLSFFSATYSQLLQSRNRFDLAMISDVSVLVVRSAGTVAVLSASLGIVALTLVQVGSGVLGVVLLCLLARRYGPQVQYGRRYLSWETLAAVFSFGTWGFLANMFTMFGYYASSAVIACLLDAEAVTFYAIGATLIGYGRTAIGYVTDVLTPDVVKAGSKSGTGDVAWLTIKGTRVTMFLAVPMLLGLMVFGSHFIRLWMGEGYSLSSAVLAILATAWFGTLANRSMMTAIYGLGRVKLLTLLSAVAAVIGLPLSLLFITVWQWGIVGVAAGMTIAEIGVYGVWLFILGCTNLGIPVTVMLRSTVLRWAIGSGLFAGVCLAVAALGPSKSWLGFVVRVVVCLAAYAPIGLLVILDRSERVKMVGALLSRFVRTKEPQVVSPQAGVTAVPTVAAEDPGPQGPMGNA